MHCVYILASAKKVLYIGMTNDLRRRLYEHKTGAIPGFAARYRIDRLVYFRMHVRSTRGDRTRKAVEGVEA